MHELSIALSLIDAASEELARHAGARVMAVHLRIGSLAGVVSDALLFSFDTAAAGTPLEGARLAITTVPARVWCGRCEGERDLEDPANRRCPVCGAPAPRLVAGDELEVVALEIAAA